MARIIQHQESGTLEIIETGEPVPAGYAFLEDSKPTPQPKEYFCLTCGAAKLPECERDGHIWLANVNHHLL